MEFHHKTLFGRFVQNLKIAGAKLAIKDEGIKRKIQDKYEYNLKVMAFSGILWQCNTSKQHKHRIDMLNAKAEGFVQYKFFKLWRWKFNTSQGLAAKEEVAKANHVQFMKKQYFKAYRQ